jgi:hypothetical protein
MFELKISEIKKAESAANKFSGRKDCKVTGYSAKPSVIGTWYEVTCEICFDYEDRADFDIVISAFMDDRRRSFATVKA